MTRRGLPKRPWWRRALEATVNGLAAPYMPLVEHDQREGEGVGQNGQQARRPPSPETWYSWFHVR